MHIEERAFDPVTEAEAVRLARDLYALEASAQSLPGEHDNNFRLTAGDSRAFVLKIMHPAREECFVDMQAQALQHLAQHLPNRTLPRVIRSKNNGLFTLVTLDDGSERIVWLLTYIEGAVLAHARPHSPQLLNSLGRLLGEIDQTLTTFSHPAAHRALKWDLSRASWIREYVPHIVVAHRRALVEKFLALYEESVVPAMPNLRRSVIYGDANDYNVIVAAPWPQPREAIAVIDFGDMHDGLMVSEVAIAAAYAMLRKPNPLSAAAEIVSGYHRAYPLNENEIAVLFSLIGVRLAVSVVNSAYRKALKPDDAYVTISEAPAWDALEQLAQIHPRFAQYAFRSACGLPANARSASLQQRLRSLAPQSASIVDVSPHTAPGSVFDLSVGSAFLGADPANSQLAKLAGKIFGEMQRTASTVGIGRYNEPRLLYTSELFSTGTNPTGARRTIHLGIDLFAEPGTPVRAPLDGVVYDVANRRAHLDYGPMVILEHQILERQILEHQILQHQAGDPPNESNFFTLYGHLSEESLAGLKIGQHIQRGERFARIGSAHENGGWPPHLHFQIVSDLFDLGTDFPGVALASERDIWTSLSPDPNLLLGIPADRFPRTEPALAETLTQRRSSLGANLSLSYNRPLKIVRGWKQYLYDDTGRAFLDVYNNVPLVGHSHPRVVKAAADQLALLNTNTRYLHDNINRYAERLLGKLPDPLRVCFFVNSGSEANELTLRLARAHTRREDVIVLDHAYHGHTSTLIDISPYKFNGPGGAGRKPWVHVAPLADDYRGLYRRDDPAAGEKYASHVLEICEQAQAGGNPIACFIAETLPSVGGQIVFPPRYLAEVYRHARAHGAVCIADEVQVGFGRLGSHFWGFETQQVIPDIVVLGKPIGNAFPLAAVITTPEIAASFANGMEFFSTFGGNPVACAAGLAVLDVLEEEGLQANALQVGAYFKSRLLELQRDHAILGDVRGLGLFLGVDLVLDRASREPASKQADYIVNRLRDQGILAGTDGPGHNVLKLRPPLIFANADADLFIGTLKEILHEDAAQINL